VEDNASRCVIPQSNRAAQATTRMSKSPEPGQPRANVEKRRRKVESSQSRLGQLSNDRKPPMSLRATLLGNLKLDNAALERNHRRVSAVAGSKLRKNVLDSTLHGVFTN
jgi:hypothetical protein